MAIDPMYHVANTLLDNKEAVIFLGAGASMGGTQKGKQFPGFSQLIDSILEEFGFDPRKKRKRWENFLEVIKKWEREGVIASRLDEYLRGDPGHGHYYLAALSIALFGESNTLLYLTTNYDDLMQRAFIDLDRNPVRDYRTVTESLRPHSTGLELRGIANHLEDHLKKGNPVVLKLFGDLNSQSPLFRQEDMKFQPESERTLTQWMKKPMIFIGYSFSDNIIRQLLVASRSESPVFVVNLDKKLPAMIKDLNRVVHIKNNFSGFMKELFTIIIEKRPSIKNDVDKILESKRIPHIPTTPPPTEPENKSVSSSRKRLLKEKKRILILASNPKDTNRIRFDEEIRDIEDELIRAWSRDQFEIKTRLAVRYNDVYRALLDYNPHIVHFIGHGETAGIKVENQEGNKEIITEKTLVQLFELFSDHVECVILNACKTSDLAKAIGQHIDYVIGMRDTFWDEAAIPFSVAFYSAVIAGKPVEKAFHLALISVEHEISDFPAHYIPFLTKKDEI